MTMGICGVAAAQPYINTGDRLIISDVDTLFIAQEASQSLTGIRGTNSDHL
ncbi:MAG: hypothetical protein R3293_14465 [Candidatus Promineifilaceae bacterium]|nr:hypothetical protein [Candidatus Promineifilaceae bacterium]